MASKRKWFKGLRIGCLSSILLIIVLSQFVSGCISFSKSDKEVSEFFETHPVKPESKFYTVDNYKMHYKALDLGQNASVIFVHGTPGSWDGFIDYFTDSTLYNQAVIISPDRPGFGMSSYGKPVASLETQSKYLAQILINYPAPRILVGHSLGGPIVARIAMDYPELVEGIIMLAPALSPDLEPKEDWFRVPMRWPIIEGMVPKIFRISNEELIFLEEELKLMLPLWKNITAQTVTIQGEEDNLVHPGNGEFADKVLINSSHKLIMLPEQNHFLPWNEPDLIKYEILEMLSRIRRDLD